MQEKIFDLTLNDFLDQFNLLGNFIKMLQFDKYFC